MRILLFDIDGTLLWTGGGGKTALQKALEREFDLVEACTDVSFSGRTDHALFGELLDRNGIPRTPQNRQRLTNAYLQRLPAVLDDADGRLLPGVGELIARLRNVQGVFLYAMTGNLHASATHKLDHFGLLQPMDGIFGGDHDSCRDDLARRSMSQLRETHGNAIEGQVVVIGDTPADIKCAHAIGADALAVCTGYFDRNQLAELEPMYLFDDLSDVETIVNLLVGDLVK